ncbi:MULTISPECIES: RICIN domain-containing protein [unclassified Streptomyces]|uniref:RICIN domain-containing protein n=1 Tax=unclassified Streptomyces TaxID=2593676 RepID=UPI00224E4CEF|nr:MULTISPECIES: RICIN domain-containing protein [unclassified Streptomyces]MCX5334523.1 RICIN domain-containing protein [Streptomyces sp. NBC_00140]MCX5364032.1 RICIN domain-containing protein [Streptomyces sp. NBC_00124]
MNLRRRVAAVLAAVALTCAPVLTGSSLTGSTPTAAAAEAVTNARLYNMGTGLCLANPSSSQTNGTVMIQWTCSNSDSNYWSLQPMTGGGYHVVNKASGQCLAIPSGSTTLGVKAIQWPCQTTQNDEQVWVHDGIDQLRNVRTGLCLAIPNGTTTAGTEAIQWNCDAVTDTTPNLDREWLW